MRLKENAPKIFFLYVNILCKRGHSIVLLMSTKVKVRQYPRLV